MANENSFLHVLLFVVVLYPLSLNGQENSTSVSTLWGEEGELWDSRGRLPYFAYAGYDAGKSEIPVFTDTVNVLDFGAATDDSISDVAAILAAISAAPDRCVLHFPAGEYVIDSVIEIRRNNLVLSGEGDSLEGTVFHLPKSATDIYGGFKGSYAAGDYGHLIVFYGGYTSNTTKIVEEALRGDHFIYVEDSKHLNVGDVISINAVGDNAMNEELWHEYHNNESHDWHCTIDWASANGGSMFHTIKEIRGNVIVLQEPLRLNIKPSWEMYVGKLTPGLYGVGIENILFDFMETPHAPHLEEPGYNAIAFSSCINFWCRDISINHCDNGIYLKSSSYGSVENITFTGRDGHHALKLAYCANNVVSSLKFQTQLPYTHTATFIHKANGNVLRNVRGENNISLDFHRNAPHSNLICDVRSAWNHASSGAGCAGPHGGARNVYWGLFGHADAIKWRNETWGHFQNTIVSALAVPERFTETQEWYEDKPDLKNPDLYEAQVRHRFTWIPDSIFDDNEYGNRKHWTERDFSRWKVESINGEKYYSLIAKDLPPVSQGRIAEYTIFEIAKQDTLELSVRARCKSNFQDRRESDMVLLCAYLDDQNYIFARISTRDYKTGIFHVKNGKTSQLESGSMELKSGEEKVLKLGMAGRQITFLMNDTLISKAELDEDPTFGGIGMGSSKNGMHFDHVELSDSISDYTVVNPVGVLQAEAHMKIQVIPNPVNDYLQIRTKATNITYSILDISGKMVQKGMGIQIPFHDLGEGMYFVRISARNTGTQTFKVIKNKGK